MSKLRVIIPVAVMVAIGVGFAFNSGIGTRSASGWKDISLLCPLGALGTMIASKTFIPQAVISLVIAAAAILLLGRAFCAWVCPVPIVGKLREVFKKPAKKQVEASSAEAVMPSPKRRPPSPRPDLRSPLPRNERSRAAATHANRCAPLSRPRSIRAISC